MKLAAPGFIFSIVMAIGWNSSNLQSGAVMIDKASADHGFTGEGKAWVSEDKRLILSGDAPRFRVNSLFENVNITLFAKRVSEKVDLDYAGIVVGARSQHETDAVCGANTYYARLTNNGKISFEKELFHGVGRNAFYPDDGNGDVGKTLFAEGLPKDRWIGFQFIVKTLINNNTQLQLSLDYDGEWRKVLDYTDNGNWRVNSDDVKCDGYYPDNKIIQAPGFTFIRNDGLGRAEYKDISIEELN